MSCSLLRWSHARESSIANMQRHVEGFCAVMAIEPSVREVGSASLIRESSLLIRIGTTRVELQRLVAVLSIRWWHRRHSMHDRTRRASDVVYGWLSTLHRQRIQLHCRRDVPRIVLAANRSAFQLPVSLHGRMFVGCFQDGIFSCCMLGFLDAETFSCILLVAQLQDYCESFLVCRALFANQPILVLNFVEARQLVHQAHRRLLFCVCERLDSLLRILSTGIA